MLSLFLNPKHSLQHLDSLVSSAHARMAEVKMIARHDSMWSAAPGFCIIFSCAPLVSSHISALDSPGQPLLLAICSNVEFRKRSFSLARVGFPSFSIASLIAALQIVASSSAEAPDISLPPQPLLPAGLTAIPPKPPQNVAAGTCSRTPTSSTAGSGCMPLDAPPPMHTRACLPCGSRAPSSPSEQPGTPVGLVNFWQDPHSHHHQNQGEGQGRGGWRGDGVCGLCNVLRL